MTRRILFTVAAIVFAASMSSSKAEAAHLACPALTTLDNLLQHGCTVGDKLYDDFTYSGDIAADEVLVQFNLFGGLYSIRFSPLNLGDAWSTDTDFGWTVSVTDPNFVISVVNDQFFAGDVPSSDTVLFCVNGDCALTDNLAIGNQQVQFDNLGVAVVVNTASYVPGGNPNGLLSIESSLRQTEVVPEPGSLMLLGMGLLGLASAARRRI